jgi:hypothetical protein
MSFPVCTVAECQSPSAARNLCNRHYQRFMRNGSIEIRKPMVQKVCSQTGATYRQINYWCLNGWVSPKLQGVGSGNARKWTPAEVGKIARLKQASDFVSRPLNQVVADLEALGMFEEKVEEAV